MRIKYRIKRWRVKLRRGTPKELELNDIQKKAYDIIIKLINDKESELVLDNETSRKGIKNKEVFIKIGRTKITIFNGDDYYEIGINDRVRDDIVEKFNSKLSRKFNILDNQATSKVSKSLNDIILHIDELKD